MNKQPQIDEMIAFLDRTSPSVIKKIREENTSFEEILKIGATLGEAEDHNQNTEELKIRATVCFAATEQTIKKCNDELPAIKSRLKGSQKLQLWAQIITAVSGASVITTLATDYKSITYAAAVLGLIGSLVPIVVDFQKKGLDKNRQLDDTYIELIRFKLEAERNIQELRFFIDNGFNADGIAAVINRCNQLCADIEERRLFS